MLRAQWRSNKYQLHSLWFDPIGARTNDLLLHHRCSWTNWKWNTKISNTYCKDGVFFSSTLLTVCPLPEKIKNEIRLIVMERKTHLVKYQTIIGKKINGCLNILVIFLKMHSLRL